MALHFLYRSSDRLGHGHQYRVQHLFAEAQSAGISSYLNSDPSSLKPSDTLIIDFISPIPFQRLNLPPKRIFYLNDLGWCNLPPTWQSICIQDIASFHVSSNQDIVQLYNESQSQFIPSRDFLNFYSSCPFDAKPTGYSSAALILGSRPRYFNNRRVHALLQSLRSLGTLRFTIFSHPNTHIHLGSDVYWSSSFSFSSLNQFDYVITGGGYLKQELSILRKPLIVFSQNRHQDILCLAYSYFEPHVPIIYTYTDLSTQYPFLKPSEPTAQHYSSCLDNKSNFLSLLRNPRHNLQPSTFTISNLRCKTSSP